MNAFTKLLSLLSLTLVLAACGGGGSSQPPAPPVINDPGPTDTAPIPSQRAYIKASNTHAFDIEDGCDDAFEDGFLEEICFGRDKFGYSVALDGDTLAVGAIQEDSNGTGVNGDQADNTAFSSGAVYVFTRDPSGVWSQQAYIKASNTGADDWLGVSVALDGDTLVVGAWGEDSSATGVDGDQADNRAWQAGAVYVFE